MIDRNPITFIWIHNFFTAHNLPRQNYGKVFVQKGVVLDFLRHKSQATKVDSYSFKFRNLPRDTPFYLFKLEFLGMNNNHLHFGESF